MRRLSSSPESAERITKNDLNRVIERHFPDRSDSSNSMIAADIQATYRQLRSNLGEVLYQCDDNNPELLDRVALDIAATICEAFQLGVDVASRHDKEQHASITDVDLHTF